jgi:thiol-disulfide isomerase/thioredoxin
MWLRQMVDMISAAVQENQYPEGLERLKQLYDKLSRRGDQKEAAGYVRYRQIFVDYVMRTQASGADQGKLQDEWQKTLDQYVKEYPQCSETPEALLQMAMYQEYNGSEATAKQFYQRIASDFSNSAAARKANGAVTRLDAVGKVLSFRGKGPGGETVDLAKYRGQVVLLQFWSTAYGPCKLDMPVLKELVSKYDGQFTVVSVSLDDKVEDLNSYLKSTRLPWPQIYEAGGLDSRPANDLGIISLPTMLLLDQNGKVVHRSVRVADLEPELKKLVR